MQHVVGTAEEGVELQLAVGIPVEDEDVRVAIRVGTVRDAIRATVRRRFQNRSPDCI